MFSNLFVLIFCIVSSYGKPQALDDAAIVVAANDDVVSNDHRNGRFLFPVGTSNDEEAAFRLPAVGSVAEESRIPRLIGGPPPSEGVANEDLAIVVVGTDNTANDGKIPFPVDNTPENQAGFRLPNRENSAAEGRGSLEIDFEIIGASSENSNTGENDDVIIVEAVRSECFETLDAGSGSDAINAYYFDSNENRCLFFFYTGSGGNSNRFSTEEECEKRCKTNSALIDTKVCSRVGAAAPICEDGCSLVKDKLDGCLRCSCNEVNPEFCKEEGGKTGLCKGSLPYWYFKQETQTCEPFVYGGCEAGSSPNKFKTKALCQKTCLKPQGSADAALPRNLGVSEQNNEKSNKSNICLEEGGKSGLCNGALNFWYFNQDTNNCESFIYGGCEAGSSPNKFETRELCETTCI